LPAQSVLAAGALAGLSDTNPNVRWNIQPTSEGPPPSLDSQFAAGAPPDVFPLDPADLARYDSLKWLRDLTGLPGAAALKADEFPFIQEQTHLDDRRVAVATSVDLTCFVYNRQHFQQAGVSESVSSYADLRTAGTELMKDRIGSYAFYWPLKTGAGCFAEDYLANGNPMFDDRLAPAFAADPVYPDVVDWRVRALQDWKIADPAGLTEDDVDEAFPHGQASFAWVNYPNLFKWQDRLVYEEAGHFGLALNPSLAGQGHRSIGTASLLAVARATAVLDQTWGLLTATLGREQDYPAIQKAWIERGTVFPYQSLLRVPAIQAARHAWGDAVTALAQLRLAVPPPGTAAPWLPEWLAFATLQSGLVLRQRLAPRDFTRTLGQRWIALGRGNGSLP
jgi:ABC-type glycerol-3-phosphate transport system substrate-binding protein